MRYQRMEFGKKNNRISLIHMNKPISNGLAGMVSSSLFMDDVAIVIDCASEESKEYDFACFGCAENGVAPRVLMAREVYYDIKRGEPYARFILFHELGHYYYNDLANENKGRDAQREQNVLNGVVSPEELRADTFAVCYLGTECVITGLNRLKELVKLKYVDWPAENINITINEIDLRIKALRS